MKDVLDLLDTHPNVKEIIGVGIKIVRIAKSKYNTKCFELVRFDSSTEIFSYTYRINSPKNDHTKFRESCRQAVQEDLRNVKLAYFKKYSRKGRVKCQETGEPSLWEELNVEHRQPNTFSIIVDRFIELHNIDLKGIKYITIDGRPDEIADSDLREKFIQYHKKKANLRLVKKYLNLGRSYQARIIRQKKDLPIE